MQSPENWYKLFFRTDLRTTPIKVYERILSVQYVNIRLFKVLPYDRMSLWFVLEATVESTQWNITFQTYIFDTTRIRDHPWSFQWYETIRQLTNDDSRSLIHFIDIWKYQSITALMFVGSPITPPINPIMEQAVHVPNPDPHSTYNFITLSKVWVGRKRCAFPTGSF